MRYRRASGGLFGGWSGFSSWHRFAVAGLVQGFFEQATRFEMSLASRGDVDDFAGARIAGGGLGSGVFNLEDPEAANLDAIALNQTIAHRAKETVYHLGGQIFFAAGVVANEEGQFFFSDRGQVPYLRGRGVAGFLGESLLSLTSLISYLLGNMTLGKVLRV